MGAVPGAGRVRRRAASALCRSDCRVLAGDRSRGTAPWGSLRHYFPGGKEQILSEALAWSGEYAASDVAEYMQSADPTPGGLFVHLLDGWARDLKRYDFGRGCPVAATTLDPGVGLPGLIDATRTALDRWLTAIEHALSAMGVTRARSQARSMLSMLEGAIIISRAQRSTAALTELRRFAPHFDAQPDSRAGK